MYFLSRNIEESVISYTLSRSSRLYKFVFGHDEGKIEGFPEPRNTRISSGLFAGLFLLMLILKPLAFGMFVILNIGVKVVAFLVDGALFRGNLLTGMQITKIEPWPRMYGRRMPPWIILAAAIVLYQYLYVSTADALEFLIFFVFITFVFMTMKPGQKSPSMELAEAIGPVIDTKLRLAYYREPRLFPVLNLID